VTIGSTGYEVITHALELLFEDLSVGNDLLLVVNVFWGEGLLEGDSEGGDGVIVRSTLVTGENTMQPCKQGDSPKQGRLNLPEVDWPLKIIHDLLALLDLSNTLAEKDHGTSGPTEGLVSSGGNDIGMLEWTRNNFGGDQSGDMSHINNQVGTDRVSDLPHAAVVNVAAVS